MNWTKQFEHLMGTLGRSPYACCGKDHKGTFRLLFHIGLSHRRTL